MINFLYVMRQDLVTFKKLPNTCFPQVHSTTVASKIQEKVARSKKRRQEGFTQHVRQRLPAA